VQLASVRELKMSLATKVLPRLTATVRSLAAGPLESAEGPRRTVALGVAPKGRGDFKLAVRVQKRALEQGRDVDLITKQAKGEVDVRYIGEVEKRASLWQQQRQRPLLIGSSVGHVKVTAGTLGCFVKLRAGGGLCILSNNHVLANENRAKKGDIIVQPGIFDGGDQIKDAVAALHSFVRLNKAAKNTLDCAIASLDANIPSDLAKLKGDSKLAGLADALANNLTEVFKIGRTTGLTRGKITAFEVDNVVVGYDIGALTFDNQIEIEGDGNAPFSAGGDSGSLILSADCRGTALLFAGSDQGGARGQGLTYANPLQAVLDALQVVLAL
jgi:hypothetical protein